MLTAELYYYLYGEEGQPMGATQKVSFEEFLRLPEENQSYELNEGELLATPSPTLYHNLVRYRLRRALADFVKTHHLGP